MKQNVLILIPIKQQIPLKTTNSHKFILLIHNFTSSSSFIRTRSSFEITIVKVKIDFKLKFYDIIMIIPVITLLWKVIQLLLTFENNRQENDVTFLEGEGSVKSYRGKGTVSQKVAKSDRREGGISLFKSNPKVTSFLRILILYLSTQRSILCPVI